MLSLFYPFDFLLFFSRFPSIKVIKYYKLTFYYFDKEEK
jgi:hypothetical protein